ncbi:hypothetical protein F7725_016859 [Dissostichus mawsoni]|uniref:Metalloproteinase inhibitor 4 n=1 Tax=Dissostichus mawsoni TaxID=36200 RepID=A0A7J5Z3G1_DISMA|nr:hypothetical protein F7725_016859 [Dissostichus mawsoni]
MADPVLLFQLPEMDVRLEEERKLPECEGIRLLYVSLCVVSREGREREKERAVAAAATFSSTRAIFSGFKSEDQKKVAERSSSGGAGTVIMALSQERSACLGLWVLLLLGAGMEEVVEGCSCHPAHPQQLFCSAEIVIRAKISGEKIVSPSNSSSPYMKMIQYEIKMIKMFKGFNKAKDIQYVYTPVFSSLCGVKLDSNNKAGYLLSGTVRTGSMWSDGRISIGQCDIVESWDNLSVSQKKNLNYRYQMGCECRTLATNNEATQKCYPQINTCYTVPCASTGENECLWTDWLLDNSLNGEQARQYACIRRSDTTCSWYRGGPPPEKDFLDLADP